MTTASDPAYSIRISIESALKSATQLCSRLEANYESVVQHYNEGEFNDDDYNDAGNAWGWASELTSDLEAAVSLAAEFTDSNLNELVTCLNRVHYNARLLLADSGVDFVEATADLARRAYAMQVARAEADAALLQSADSSRLEVETSWLAQHVSQFAARLLSPEHRASKAEEFACELYEIAAAGAPRRRQVAHAVRVLAYVLPLRRALSRSRRAVRGGSQR